MEPYTSPFLGFDLYVFELVFITARQQPDFHGRGVFSSLKFGQWTL
jgi:hypothetical protein